MARGIETAGAADTEALGAELAATLVPGDLVLVQGELGAGKTTFVRGACRALGVTGPITSPTFTIGQRYTGRVAVSHLDLYRIEALDREDPALLDDYVTADAIAFVEWPGGFEAALGALAGIACRVHLTHLGGDRRSIEIDRGTT
jgi:tRNA threonylcarbamoyladenosine biosynthesis protein TsaE